MNDKKVRFAHAVFEGKTNMQAAIDAGYLATSAYQTSARLIKDKDVLELIARLKYQAKQAQNDPASAFSTVQDEDSDMKKLSVDAALSGDYIPSDNVDRTKNRGNCKDIDEMDESELVIIPPCHGDPKKFLEMLLDNNLVDVKSRLDAAKALMPYKYKKLGEVGKKEQKEEDAKKASNGFAPGKSPMRAAG
jgi:phage terminase small subunit